MRKLYCLLMGLAMFLCQDIFAQTREITGTVTNAADSSALGDVTVKVKNSQVNTVTQADGTFRLTVPANATSLVFSYVGFSEVELPISDLMSVSMSPGKGALNEVVVVGYGTASKR